MRAPTCSGPEM